MHGAFLTTHKGKMVLCIVLSKDSLKRIVDHDPLVHNSERTTMQVVATLGSKVTKEEAGNLPVSLLDIVIAYEDDPDIVAAKGQELGSSKALLKWLSRGWTHQPGDEDFILAEDMPKERHDA